MSQDAFLALNVAVLTVSDTRTPATDTSGAEVARALEEAGHKLVGRSWLPDDRTRLEAQLRAWVAAPDIAVVIASGGTGITLRDVTPEALAPLVTKPIEGFGELFRALSYQEIGASALQSRAMGAVCDTTLVFLLPGSTSAVRLAMQKIILPQLDRRTRPCNFAMLLDRL